VRIGGTLAALGVLLSLVAGVSRTAFAMAADRHLPGWLDAVHPTHRVPHRAVLAVGAAVALVVTVADLRGAIGFSSCTVLVYYAIANASAWTLPAEQRRWPRALAAAGLVGCLVLAGTLPVTSVLLGVGVLVAGSVVWVARGAGRSRLA
jgi:APA family basic amino acid/polyamine antiporter